MIEGLLAILPLIVHLILGWGIIARCFAIETKSRSRRFLSFVKVLSTWNFWFDSGDRSIRLMSICSWLWAWDLWLLWVRGCLEGMHLTLLKRISGSFGRQSVWYIIMCGVTVFSELREVSHTNIPSTAYHTGDNASKGSTPRSINLESNVTHCQCSS